MSDFTDRTMSPDERFRDAAMRFGRFVAFQILEDDLRVVAELQSQSFALPRGNSCRNLQSTISGQF